jgi:undecaprenyl phosphate-alpha-L-ara4N flippase subunit ArnE
MQQLKVVLLVVTYVAVSTFSNVAYKLSVSGGVRNLLTWQILANVVGILGVVSLSWLYKLIPMHIAYPVVQALLIVSIQVVAARLIFKENITVWQWIGTGLVVLGIFLIATRGKA